MGGIAKSVGKFVGQATGKPDADAQTNAVNSQTEVAKALAGISQDYYNQTAPLRSSVISNASNFMNGGMNPANSFIYQIMNQGMNDIYGQTGEQIGRNYATAKDTAETQFNTARNSAMSELPAGGALLDALGGLYNTKAKTLSDYGLQGANTMSNLGISQAGNMSSILANIIQDEYNKAYNLASGSQTNATSGLSGASGAYGQVGQNYANQAIAGAQQLNAMMQLGKGLGGVPWSTMGKGIYSGLEGLNLGSLLGM